MLDDKLDDVTALLKSISHPLRLKILCLLQDGELSVGDIQKQVKTTHANVSQHLRILRHQGIVRSRKDANFIYNSISDQRIVLLVNTLQALYC